MTPAIALNLIALIGMLVARSGVAVSARHSAVSDRLRALYGVATALIALRLLAAAVPAAAPLVMLAAAWLPFLLLRLAEEMVRRHAPRVLKYIALGGAVLFSVLALTLGIVWSGLAIGLLAGFHALAAGGTVIFLFTERTKVSPSERDAASLLAIALLIASALSLTDFKALFPNLDVRGGTFAVIVLLFATSRLATGRGRVGLLFLDIAVAVAAGAIAAALASSQSWPAPFSMAAVTAALAALAITVERFNGLRAQGGGLASALVAAGESRADMLFAHPLLARARQVPSSALADYPEADIAQLSRHRLISFAIADREPDLGAAMRDLLERNAATHLLRVSTSPLTFLAVSADGFAEGSLDTDLYLAARMLEQAV